MSKPSGTQFDEEAAARAVRFIEGVLAATSGDGKPQVPVDWQRRIIHWAFGRRREPRVMTRREEASPGNTLRR
jgi:hypothetical protein